MRSHTVVLTAPTLEETGFELLVADTLEENAAPSPEELRLLRDEIDKDRYSIWSIPGSNRPPGPAAGESRGCERRACVVTRVRVVFARGNPPSSS